VPWVSLDPAIEAFQHRLHGSCAELLLNLDEVGISEWENRHQRKVIIPSAIQDRRFSAGFTVSQNT
jgi:hypothetical protein